MCGIAGIVDLSMSAEERTGRLAGMLGSIIHRGPDSQGSHDQPDLGLSLGIRRLSIIDLAGGEQPMWNEDRTIGVVFNGEIYNYRELRQVLMGAGHQFRTQSDTEVLVHLYEQHGLEMFVHLRGMFAFAIFDLRKRSLLLARDHFGQKPLYYCHRQGRLAFASEIKGLRHVPFVSQEVDESAYLDYLFWLSLPAPQTHFRDVQKLMPGSYLEVRLSDCASAGQQRFWRFRDARRADLGQMRRAVDALEAALADSLAVHVRADVPVGVLLSSGVDSLSVGLYAQRVLGRGLATFSVGTESDATEHLDAERVARRLGTRHHHVILSGAEFAGRLERVAWHLDEPIGDPAACAVMLVCELARQHVKVVLSGEGADELFGGYAGRYQGMRSQLERSAHWRAMRYFLHREQAAFPTNRWRRMRQRVYWSRGEEAVSLRTGLSHETAKLLLVEEHLQRMRHRQQAYATQLYSPERDLLGELMALDMQWQLAESLLQKGDKMSMAASLELRCPFLDIAVADVAARVPAGLKLGRTGPGKLVLRQCVDRRLPGAGNAPKRGFALPLRRWLAGDLRQQVEDMLFSADSKALQWTRPGSLAQLWEECKAGRSDVAHLFYGMLIYEVWRRSLRQTLPAPALVAS